MRTHATVRRRALAEERVCPLLSSGLAVSGSQEEGASLTFTGRNTTGDGEDESSLKRNMVATAGSDWLTNP